MAATTTSKVFEEVTHLRPAERKLGQAQQAGPSKRSPVVRADLLETRRSGAKIRWDRAHPGFCQHQKSWLIDAGADDEIAFVGGINLNPHSVVAPVILVKGTITTFMSSS